MKKIYLVAKNLVGLLLAVLVAGGVAAAATPTALYQQAVDKFNAGDLRAAQKILKDGVQVFPNSSAFPALLGVLLVAPHTGKIPTPAIRRDVAQALNYYNTAVVLNSNNPEYYLMRAFAYYDLEKYREAQKQVEEFQLRAPGFPLGKTLQINLNMISARANFAAENYPLAMTAATEVVRLAPKDNEAYNLRAIINLELEDYSAAAQDLKKALEISPQNETHLYNRAYLNYEIGNYLAARADLRLVYQITPQQGSDFYHLRALVEQELNNLPQAYADFNQAVKLNAQSWGIYNDRAVLRVSMNDLSGARKDLVHAQRLAPNNPIIAKNLALLAGL